MNFSPDEVAAALLRFQHDAYGFALWAFPWGRGVLADAKGPLEWQAEELRAVSAVRPDSVVRRAVASGHGIGKSAVTAIITLWAMSTYPDTRGVITANTEKQLQTKTFAELSRWFHLSPLTGLFDLTATALYAKDPRHSKTWRCDIIPWSERNPEAFAGLHNKGRRQFLIFDEASAISDTIFETASGALTDKGTERLWLLYGNPTRNTGYFRECFPPDGRFHGQWTTKQIDSREVPLSDKDLLAQWAKTYGEDSDFFRVRVAGQFPESNTLEFIPRKLAREAARRKAQPQAGPVVLGVDVARYGDDSTVVYVRQGLDGRSVGWFEWTEQSTVRTAHRIAELAAKYRPALIAVDEGGVGGGVVDQLLTMRTPHVVGVQFGGKPYGLTPGVKFMNRRAELWWQLREWLRRGGAIPLDDGLVEELSTVCQKRPKAEASADKVLLESKAEIKARGGRSPNIADALALTFAVPVFDGPSSLDSARVPRYDPIERVGEDR